MAPRRTGPGSFERARRVLYAHIFCHLGEPDWCHWKMLVAPSTPIFLCTDRTNRSRFKGNIGKKHCSLRIFLSETIAPRRTGPGSFENLTGVIGKGSSSPLRTYFFRPDRNNRSRVITFKGNKGKKHCSLRIFLSETIAPRRTGPGSGKKHCSLRIFLSETIAPRRTEPGSLEKGSSRPLRPYFFRPDRTNRSRVITANGTLIIGKDSSRPLGPYFFRPDRTNRSRAITHLGEPDRGRLKEVVAPSTPIFFAYRIFLSETIAPRRTERGSLERARRALYAYIVFVQIGPIGAEWNKGKKNFSFAIFFSETVAPRRTGPGSFERARRALYAHIFFVQIGPIGAELLQFKDNKGKKHFYLRIFLSETIAPRRTGPRSFESARRALYAYIFLENQSGVIGKGSSRPLRPYFPRPDRTNRSRVITVFREQRKKNFSLTIFFSETIAPRRTGPGSFHLGEPYGGHWKGLVKPSTHIFFSSRSEQ
ncbi:hypothetical protein V1477_006718 [Vespula maculifrons]|uniref:Uncharacterized protein n=1 Tax=Vespula maculifrons TaxID=7453 RepID=A0ABD2CK10_VESMC